MSLLVLVPKCFSFLVPCRVHWITLTSGNKLSISPCRFQMRSFHGIQNYLTFWNTLKSLWGREVVTVITQVQYNQLSNYSSALTAALPPSCFWDASLRITHIGQGRQGEWMNLDSCLQASYPTQNEIISNRGAGGASDICGVLAVGVFEVGSGSVSLHRET